jgi:hypothetical protein
MLLSTVATSSSSRDVDLVVVNVKSYVANREHNSLHLSMRGFGLRNKNGIDVESNNPINTRTRSCQKILGIRILINSNENPWHDNWNEIRVIIL